ncbi:TM0106 family RecB-like putative nuclease [Mycobacteroides saopaulense]|uniref:Nuclease n=1 Tax=Mycobacteroides saopaulense TaxID=1578165 RepID=A0ABX3C3V2_9MYCO|nr:TM0106 family RecB-like putative nuclease [Mycobacteroides saopaulense]OHT81402.1 nuclease [Mycobacteroides saopaulense]OHU13074.1 nuclease [Mycobacteroides saopaulense]
MFVLDDRVVYSASDLASAARCEYALLRAFDAKLGWGPAAPRDDELLARTATLGDAHEAHHLAELQARFGSGVASIPFPPMFTLDGLHAVATATTRAFEEGHPVVYQAAMFDGRFVGFADFVVREGQTYRVCDTKLARSAKVTALLQLAAYADSLAATGVPVSPDVRLILGDRSVVDYPVADLVGVYRQRRIQLQDLLDRHMTGGVPVQWSDDHVRACFRCPACEPEVERTDDLLLVAGMRVSQRAALLDAGVGTVEQLAGHREPVADLSARSLRQLAAQAELQVRQRDSGTPQFEVVDPIPLGTLPAPNPGDIFFDFEGDPLWTEDGVQWGLEYLFGVLEYDRSGHEKFQPIWAHDRRTERKALIAFLDLVAKRRRRHPGMHVYHYAAYEKTALLRLAGRYGVGEDQIDDLLRDNVLVDLYPLVRKSIRSGSSGYGLKALEPLFIESGKRSGEVTTAVDSINEYARYCTLRDNGDPTAQEVLDSIAEYNRYDCASTRKLRDWLLVRAFEHGITHLSSHAATGDVEEVQTDEVGLALAGFAGDASPADRTPEQTAAAMVSAARGYHTRERKPFWWSHFDRLNNPVDEWADTAGVFIVEGAELVQDWHKSGSQRKLRRHVKVTGDLAGGVLDDSVYALYEPPAPSGLGDGDPDRRASGSATVVEVTESGGVPVDVTIQELTPKNGEVFSEMPMALAPGAPVMTKALEAAIEEVAAEVAHGLPEMPRTASLDILLRRNPRGGPLPPVGEEGYAGAITSALRSLDSSYLAVHGPPGTGKTSTAARVIAELVTRDGWLVGVVAQSHAVVEHLLDQIVAAGVPCERVAKKASPYSGDAAWTQIRDSDYAGFLVSHAGEGAVIGGTAWDFANTTRVADGVLRLLVVDEAGQFSLANTLAVARGAQNLLLLGDPQQLPQVSQGVHPEPVDTSALGWLVEGHGALPAERGYFLERSYRMHPALCQHISRLSYDGELESAAPERALTGQRPGVRTLLVDHEGNATSSPQEAEAIAAEIASLIGSDWTDESGTRPLAQSDVLVVAPYNAQVLTVRAALAAAGLGEVLVGTVDKFQGRQAPVVFVSMTASAVDDVPRGMSFLLNRNRLNVAISRAKFQAVIVRSPALTEYLPATPDGLVELGAFLALSPAPTNDAVPH